MAEAAEGKTGENAETIDRLLLSCLIQALAFPALLLALVLLVYGWGALVDTVFLWSGLTVIAACVGMVVYVPYCLLCVLRGKRRLHVVVLTALVALLALAGGFLAWSVWAAFTYTI